MTAVLLSTWNKFNSTNALSWCLGLLLSSLVALLGMGGAQLSWVHELGISALTMAIFIGILVGNTVFPHISHHCAVGVDFSKNKLLRYGIILFGFKVSFQQISGVGWVGFTTALAMIVSTFLIAYLLGTKVFKLDRQTAILIGAGSSICGAAAILATEPVIRAQAHKVTIAVATVVIFGTISMLLYPLLYPYLGLSEHAYGIFAGSTIHEVAQVVVAGHSVSNAATGTAVIEKMLRVMLLAPFLLVLSFVVQDKKEGRKHSITIPWFAFLFILVSGLNSLNIIPEGISSLFIQLDTILLTMAMAALGLRTHIGAVRQAGFKPLLLAAILFIFLIVGGLYINEGISVLFNSIALHKSNN